MISRIGVTLDCHQPSVLAEFWKLALGYEDEPPPAPYTTREEWLAQFDLSDDDQDDGAWLHDLTGRGPRLFLQQVPEPKVAKNRMHFDIFVSGSGTPDERQTRIAQHVKLLTAAGGRTVRENNGHGVVMADPEGNEFCVA